MHVIVGVGNVMFPNCSKGTFRMCFFELWASWWLTFLLRFMEVCWDVLRIATYINSDQRELHIAKWETKHELSQSVIV